jgi:N-methylhydantoinase B
MSAPAPAGTRVDPITASVIAGALESIAVEMGHKLAHMSYSSIIRESEDFGCVICDEQARQLAESSQSTPLQSGPIPGYIRGINRRFAELGEEWKPGDVVIHNHAYYGASHEPDVGFVVPIFHGGELVAFSATAAHHLDLGALTPGSCGIVDATSGSGASSGTTSARPSLSSATWRRRWPHAGSARSASRS